MRRATELTLDPPDTTSDQAGAPLLDEDYLILSTIHSAQGQEWKSVFVLMSSMVAFHRTVTGRSHVQVEAVAIGVAARLFQGVDPNHRHSR